MVFSEGRRASWGRGEVIGEVYALGLLNKHANYCAIFDYDFSALPAKSDDNNASPGIFVYVNRPTARITLNTRGPRSFHRSFHPLDRPAVSSAAGLQSLHAFNTQRLFCIQILLLLYWIGAATMALFSSPADSPYSFFLFWPFRFVDVFFCCWNYVKWKSVQFFAWHLFVVMFFGLCHGNGIHWKMRTNKENKVAEFIRRICANLVWYFKDVALVPRLGIVF